MFQKLEANGINCDPQSELIRKKTSNKLKNISNYIDFDSSEVETVQKLILISKMIPHNLFFLGIIIKCLNDDNRPKLSPLKLKNILNAFFDADLKDFILVIINKITFGKLESSSANFGVNKM